MPRADDRGARRLHRATTPRRSETGRPGSRCISAGGEEGGVDRLAGRVHDLGKLAISEEVLPSPARLSPEERLADRDALRGRLPDGRPRSGSSRSRSGSGTTTSAGTAPGIRGGLRGEQIPIGSRILAVADACEAMTSDRVYKAGMSLEAALGELQPVRPHAVRPGASSRCALPGARDRARSCLLRSSPSPDGSLSASEVTASAARRL